MIALTCKGYGLIWAMIFIYIALHYHISTVILYVIILTSRPHRLYIRRKSYLCSFVPLRCLVIFFFLSMVQLQQKTERENCIESLIQILNYSRCLCWWYGVGCERIQWHIFDFITIVVMIIVVLVVILNVIAPVLSLLLFLLSMLIFFIFS